MNRRNLGAALFLLCCLNGSRAEAQVRTRTAPQTPQAMTLFCYATDRTTIYFSDLFTVPIPNTGGSNTAFSQFLSEKYSFKAPGVCTGGLTDEQARSVRQQSIASYEKRNLKVVEISWKFDPSTVPAAAARPNTGSTPAQGDASAPAQPQRAGPPPVAAPPPPPPAAAPAPVRALPAPQGGRTRDVAVSTPAPAPSTTPAKAPESTPVRPQPAPVNTSASRAPSAPATAAPADAGSIRTYCLTDPEKPTVYYSEIFDTGIPMQEGGSVDTFARLLNAGLDFDQYLWKKYSIPVPNSKDSTTTCYIRGPLEVVQRQQTDWIQQQSAKKKLVLTDWKYTPRPAEKPATSSAPQPQALPPGPGVLTWKQTTRKDPLTDETSTQLSAQLAVGDSRPASLLATTQCTSTGFHVVLSVSQNGRSVSQPPLSWAQDDKGNHYIVMRVRVDTGSAHQTIAYADSDGEGATFTEYLDSPRLLFYDSKGVDAYAEDLYRTGVPLVDNAFGNLTREVSRSNAQSIKDNAAGSLPQFLSAGSIRVEIPLSDGQKPIVDLNPKDRLLQNDAQQCSRRIGGR